MEGRAEQEAAMAQAQHATRYFGFTQEDDHSVGVFGRLPPEVGAIVMKAIEAAIEIHDADPRGSSVEECPRDPIGARRAV